MEAQVYFNEFDPQIVAWLRELIRVGYLEGEVDERSIREVRPADVAGFRRCHFFGGVGTWELALRLAGWPEDREVWTGSCPCQPFSSAGKRKAKADDRHLWPEFFRLIRECRPVTVFGEQVESPDGRAWLDDVCADLEGVGYAVGTAVTPAAGFGAPHARHRIYWVAHALPAGRAEGRSEPWFGPPARGGIIGGVAHAASERRQEYERGQRTCGKSNTEDSRESGDVADPGLASTGRHARPGGDPAATGRRRIGRKGQASTEPPGSGAVSELGDTERSGVRFGGCGPDGGEASGVQGEDGQRQRVRSDAGAASGTPRQQERPVNGFWSDADWIHCRPEPRYPQGRWRPVRPGSFPLAHGVAARVVRLRGFGNGLVLPQAVEFIKAFLEVEAAG